MYEANDAAIMMANNNKPNGWTQHININYFTLQEWVIYGKVKLSHICRVTNPADALTKALGWALHCCHVMRIMDYLGTKYTNTVGYK
eukprot:9931254-Ditylum_brightwellii.AAC.1